MTHDEHRERHRSLHRQLDELLADFLRWNSGKLPSGTTVMELLTWSHSQTVDPMEMPEDNGYGDVRDTALEVRRQIEQDKREMADWEPPRVSVEVSPPMGYSRVGDVVTLVMSRADYEALVLSLGMAAGQAGRDRATLNAYLALANRLNAGNPEWTPYMEQL